MESASSPMVDNAKAVLELLRPLLRRKQETASTQAEAGESRPKPAPPLIIGLTGLQGSGKSTWAGVLVDLLQRDYGLRALTISLDDLYRTHDKLVELRDSNAENKLLQTRGQPGTHDEALARKFFAGMKQNARGGSVKVPAFDKSKFGGQGDRVPEGEWPTVQLPVDVIIFEGWCLGFRPLPDSAVTTKHQHAKAYRSHPTTPAAELTNTLPDHSIEHLLSINTNLAQYDESFMGPRYFDAFVHLDTPNLENVYTWRIEQEHALKKAKGTGMSDDEVIRFVRGYMPAYELYLDQLRRGFFRGDPEQEEKTHVQVQLDRQRNVVSCQAVQ